MTDKQTKLIEKYRDCNVDYSDWYENIYDTFREDMSAVGIYVSDIQFSGFWSQGSGASFTGSIEDIELFLKHHKLEQEYPWVTKLVSLGGGFDLRITRTASHYVHENTVSATLEDTDMFSNILNVGDDGLREHIVDDWDYRLDQEYTGIETDVTAIIRGYCQNLYMCLDAEHEYLTSDEAVWEAIIANEWETTIEAEEEDMCLN
jgi:hypothetical protein